MFVITADQRGSRRSPDLVPHGLRAVEAALAGGGHLGPERTVGDELQVAVDRAESALAVVLSLSRGGAWSIGLGIGDVTSEPSASIRQARGDAFVHARTAVESAKRVPARFSLIGDGSPACTDAESLIRLLIDLRDRRTEEGWEVYDLLAGGVTQKQAAQTLGITPSAVSLRARAAGLRVEEAAVPALERVLDAAARGAAAE